MASAFWGTQSFVARDLSFLRLALKNSFAASRNLYYDDCS
jgi:hypothetical protein